MTKILAINPGSTSTKIALYEDNTELFSEPIEHGDEQLAGVELLDQFDIRKKVVLDTLSKKGYKVDELAAVVGRGGLVPGVEAGGYEVNDDLKDALRNRPIVKHASNLGGLIADAIAAPLGIPAYIYDCVTSDEMDEVAKITGIPEIRRQSMCHVLNQKAVGRLVAKKMGKNFDECNFIIAHLGGGISIGAHKQGKMVDTMSDDYGPFAPERCGGAPVMFVVDLCYSGKYDKATMLKKLRGNAGVKAYLNTVDMRKVIEMIDAGDEQAKLIYDAMIYNIAKGIGHMSVALKGEIDAIILTGGIAHSKRLTDQIADYIKFIAPVEVVAGENEMEALALGALRLVKGDERAKEYKQ